MSSHQEEAHGSVRVMRFSVGDLGFAIAITEIREIIPKTEIRSVPQAPGFVEGVLNLRGEIIPVVDLRKLFGVEPTTAEYKIILRQVKQVTVGYIVDQVSHVLLLSKAEILDRPPVVIKGLPKECIYGLFQQEEETVILIDLSEAMNSEEVHKINELMSQV